jgi:hypothetical protein
MLLRIGVEDGEESTARMAIAEAAKGCVQMFQEMLAAWRSANGIPLPHGIESSKPLRKKSPSIGKPLNSVASSAAANAANAAAATQ